MYVYVNTTSTNHVAPPHSARIGQNDAASSAAKGPEFIIFQFRPQQNSYFRPDPHEPGSFSPGRGGALVGHVGKIGGHLSSQFWTRLVQDRRNAVRNQIRSFLIDLVNHFIVGGSHGSNLNGNFVPKRVTYQRKLTNYTSKIFEFNSVTLVSTAWSMSSIITTRP